MALVRHKQDTSTRNLAQTLCLHLRANLHERQTEESIIDGSAGAMSTPGRMAGKSSRISLTGISGAAAGNRPGFEAALARAQAGNTILVADTTRIFRSQDLALLVTRLKFRDIGALDGFDSTSAHAGMQADALAAGTLSKV